MKARCDCYTGLLILATAAVLAPLLLVIEDPHGTVMAAATSTGYRTLARRTLGGEGFWDYLTMDPAARRLYISRWTHVMVCLLYTSRCV